MKLLDTITIELNYLDDYGRTLELGSYYKEHDGLALDNDTFIDCEIGIEENDSGYGYEINNIKQFDENGFEIIDIDEDYLRQLIKDKIVFL